MCKCFVTIALLLLLLVAAGTAQQLSNIYSPGDWVTYTNSRYVTAIARGFSTVYFGTTEGILRYDVNLDKWLDPITTSNGMPENRIRRLAVDRLTDDIWIETTNYTAYYNPTFEEWRQGEPFPQDKVQPQGPPPSQFPQLFVNRNFNYVSGGILVGRNLLQYEITNTLRDDPDIVWVGVWGLGPGEVDLRRYSLDVMPIGPYDSDVAALTADANDIWILGGGAGMPGVISHWDRNSDEWEYFQPRYQPNIVSDQFYVIKSDDSNIWMGTELGLVRYNKKKNSFWSLTSSDGIYGDRVTAILPTPNNIIIGTDMGVSVYDLKRDSIYVATSNRIRGRDIYDLALGDRTIYAATNEGIYTLNWGGSSWEKFLPSELVLQGLVSDIQVEDSLLYAVGDDGVVICNLLSGDYRLYDLNTVFGNADLHVLLVHQGLVWVAGDEGVFRLNNRTDEWYHYRPADGLASYRVTSLAGDGRYVWFGTDQGVTRFFWDNRGRSDWK